MAQQPPSPDDFEPSFHPRYQWNSNASFLRVSSLSLISKTDNLKVNETDVTKFAYFEQQKANAVGPYMLLSFNDDENEESAHEEVRFFWMESQYDLNSRRDTYAFKLYAAWVSSAKATIGYYYWNINNQGPSELIIPKIKGNQDKQYQGIRCDYVEIKFKDQYPKHSKHSRATLIMNDVEIGLLSTADEQVDMDNLRLYNPCQAHRKCTVIDGKLYCGQWRPWVVYTLITVLVSFLTILGYVLGSYCAKQVKYRYRQLSRIEEDDECENNNDLGDDHQNEINDDEYEDEQEENGIELKTHHEHQQETE